MLLLVWWLMAVADGAEAQARAQYWLTRPVARLAGVLFLFALVYHLVAGIRHLVWDTGRGLERRQSQTSAWLVAIVSVLVTLLLLVGFGHGGHP